MFFKLVFLITVCSSVVISKSISRRDLPAIEYDETSLETHKKDIKRDDKMAKELIAGDVALPPLALEASEEKVEEDATYRMNKQLETKIKRLVEEKEVKSKCCG